MLGVRNDLFVVDPQQSSLLGSGYLITPGNMNVGADKGETRRRRSVDSSDPGMSESQGLIQSLKDEIESIRRPHGTQTNPARTCKDLLMCNGKMKNGENCLSVVLSIACHQYVYMHSGYTRLLLILFDHIKISVTVVIVTQFQFLLPVRIAPNLR